MAVRIYIPTPYRKYTGGVAHVELAAEQPRSVSEVLGSLAHVYPELAPRVLDERGEIQHHLNVYVNQNEVRSLQGGATPVRDGDEVALIPVMAGGALTEEQIQRYSRHIILSEVGGKGQQKLLDAKVLVIGAGGLGSPILLYLAAAGVGTIGIVEFDTVDLSNLQRQIIHRTSTVGQPKAESARSMINDLNPDVKVVMHNEPLHSGNAMEILSRYDVIVNGCDNFPTRYLVNDACVFLKKPLVDGSILRFEGQATVFMPGQGCYRCLYPSPPPPGTVPSCSEAGILGALAGVVGVIQAVETLKVILNIGETLAGKLLYFDAMTMDFHKLNVKRNPECPVCGDHPTITELIDYEQFCGAPAREG